MKREITMKKTRLFISVTAMTIALASSALAQEVTLRFHQFLPPQAAIPAHAIQPWIEKIEADSDGRIKIEHYPSMQLGGSPPALYNQARDGVVDIIWTVMGYMPGRFRKTEAFELPFMAGNAEQTSLAFQEFVEIHAMDEFRDIHLIAVHVHGPGWIHSNKPIAKLEDIAGQKLRGPTRMITNLLGELGATAIGMPVPAVPEALSKGVIDGTVIPWDVTLPLKVPELVDNHAGFDTMPAFYTATFVIAMNKDKYDSMPDDLKAVLDASSGAYASALFGRAMDESDVRSRVIAEATDNTIIAFDDVEKARWVEAAKPVVSEWIAEMDALNIDGQAMIDAAKALIAKHTE
jgi:TRAP-type C4-dicarboxylate transport system substrate-binding protein